MRQLVIRNSKKKFTKITKIKLQVQEMLHLKKMLWEMRSKEAIKQL